MPPVTRRLPPVLLLAGAALVVAGTFIPVNGGGHFGYRYAIFDRSLEQPTLLLVAAELQRKRKRRRLLGRDEVVDKAVGQHAGPIGFGPSAAAGDDSNRHGHRGRAAGHSASGGTIRRS